MQPILRFAPSPNGYLHLGHAYSALINARIAERVGGKLLLRMENIDSNRCKAEFETAIIEDLAWMGVRFDGEIRRQSDHLSDYDAALARLVAAELAYSCFCTRSQIARAVENRTGWSRDPDGSQIYPGTCRLLSGAERQRRTNARRPFALRIDIEKARASIETELVWREFGEGETERLTRAEPQAWGDAVLARRDIAASYHIAVVVDDHLQGVTNVVRGKDLFHATALHRLLQTLFGWSAPAYHHHDLVRDERGDKLSKRTAAKSIRSLRREGMSAQEIRRRLGF